MRPTSSGPRCVKSGRAAASAGTPSSSTINGSTGSRRRMRLATTAAMR